MQMLATDPFMVVSMPRQSLLSLVTRLKQERERAEGDLRLIARLRSMDWSQTCEAARQDAEAREPGRRQQVEELTAWIDCLEAATPA